MPSNLDLSASTIHSNQEATCVSTLGKKDRRRIACHLKKNKKIILLRWLENQFDPILIDKYKIVGIADHATMLQSYMSPLFNLFVAALETGERRYLEVYLDERLRYAPHQADPDVVSKFFNAVLDKDEAAVIDTIERISDAYALRDFFSKLHSPLREYNAGDAIRLLAVGDCLLNELRVFLPPRMRDANIALDMRCIYFSAVVGRALSAEQLEILVENTSPNVIAFSFLTYEGLPPYSALLREADRLTGEEIERNVAALIGIIREFIEKLRTRTDATFLVHNACGLPLGRLRRLLPLMPPLSGGRKRALSALNAGIAELCQNTPNTLLVDEVSIAKRYGYRTCSRPVIERSISKGAAFHTNRFGEYLTETYSEILHSYRLLSDIKVLCVDFDNTLWDGVMADGNVTHYPERQRLLRTLKEAGILLLALSKNDPENIRWEEMGLSPSDFVLHKINWGLKAKNVADAAQELDLGLRSFLLIDDNPVERELVRNELPMVKVLDATEASTWQSLERLLAFPNTRTTEEAKHRTELYRSQAQRREAQNQSFDYPSMMAGLQLKASFGLATARDLDRITELSQRTNQFNTTTIRYSRTDIQRIFESRDYALYVAELADKFGKLGIVGTIILRLENGQATFESFVMSCRAMGFGLEQLMLSRALEAGGGATCRFIGRYIATDRNTPAMSLYGANGFAQIDQEHWCLEPGAPRPVAPTWFLS